MQSALHVLRHEHELVELAAACLERIADRAASGEVDVYAALDLLEFLDHCANGTHQCKEERVLFPALLERGLGTHRVGELLLEHVEERASIAELQGLVEGAAYGEVGSLDRFANLARKYARAQVEHARKEEHTLLPIVEELLDDDLDERLVARFRAIDASHGTHTGWEYEEELAAIASRLDVAPARPANERLCGASAGR